MSSWSTNGLATIFSPLWGSDERQLCSPKIDLPVVQVSKTFYGEYKEYHTSYDDKKFMSINSLTDSIDDIFLFIKFMELNRNYLKPVIKGGEPMLSKRGLYPSVNTVIKNIEIKNYDNLFKIISLIDGKKNLIEILNFLNISIKEFVNTLDILYQKRLIKF